MVGARSQADLIRGGRDPGCSPVGGSLQHHSGACLLTAQHQVEAVIEIVVLATHAQRTRSWGQSITHKLKGTQVNQAIAREAGEVLGQHQCRVGGSGLPLVDAWRRAKQQVIPFGWVNEAQFLQGVDWNEPCIEGGIAGGCAQELCAVEVEILGEQ